MRKIIFLAALFLLVAATPALAQGYGPQPSVTTPASPVTSPGTPDTTPTDSPGTTAQPAVAPTDETSPPASVLGVSQTPTTAAAAVGASTLPVTGSDSTSGLVLGGAYGVALFEPNLRQSLLTAIFDLAL